MDMRPPDSWRLFQQVLVYRRLLDTVLLQPGDHAIVLLFGEHEITHHERLIITCLLEGCVGPERKPRLYRDATGGDVQIASRQVDAVDVACHKLPLLADSLPDSFPVDRAGALRLVLFRAGARACS